MEKLEDLIKNTKMAKEYEENPFVSLIVNETKLKLKNLKFG